eukprot:COSAG05_NODE_901_length_6665_cov_4.080262_8_plen_103_part_00
MYDNITVNYVYRSNGFLGYIPPPSAFNEGGMEVVEASWYDLLPSQLTPAIAVTAVDHALGSISRLIADTSTSGGGSGTDSSKTLPLVENMLISTQRLIAKTA